MIYREAGQFKESYASDQAIFAIPQDRIFVAALRRPVALRGAWLLHARHACRSLIPCASYA